MFGLAVAVVLKLGQGSVPTSLVFFVIAATALNLAYYRQFKHVSLQDTCLVVTDDRRIAHVPLGRIERVSKVWSRSPPSVMVVLRTRSKFGRRIMFIPSAEARLIVSRLLKLCNEHSDTACPHERGQIDLAG